MSINVDIFSHDKAGWYYVVYQHNVVYEVCTFRNRSTDVDNHHVRLGEIWPNGEVGSATMVKFGAHLRVEDVSKQTLQKVMTILTNEIIHV